MHRLRLSCLTYWWWLDPPITQLVRLLSVCVCAHLRSMPESMLADYYVALADMKNVLTMSERFRQVGTRTVQVSRTCNQIRFDYCLPILTVWTRLSFRLNKWNLCVGCTTVDKLLSVWLVFYLCCAVSKLTLTWRVTNNEILPPLGLQSSPAFSFCGQ